jgi:hypothetical protein
MNRLYCPRCSKENCCDVLSCHVQVWHGLELPPASAFGLPARMSLQQMLQLHFADTVEVITFPDG